jgi:hypothetical protein
MPEDDYLLEDDSMPHDPLELGQDATDNVVGEDDTASADTSRPRTANGYDSKMDPEAVVPTWRPAEADWTAMDAEVEAALLESDDDTGPSDASEPVTNLSPRKRPPLESDDEASEDENSGAPGSPLLKRQRVARSRSGKSRLKVSFGSADDDGESEQGDAARAASSDTESDMDWDAYADSLEGEFS